MKKAIFQFLDKVASWNNNLKKRKERNAQEWN